MLQGEHKEGSIVEHLEELRWAIIRSLLSIAVFFPVTFHYSEWLTGMLVEKLCPDGLKLRYFSPVEPFFVQMKMAFYLAVFVAAPYILRQVWSFVAPGLYGNERRLAGLLLLISCLLFATGTIFSLAVILPVIMTFSAGFQTAYLEAAIGFEQFINLAGLLSLGFGIMFQCPALTFILVRAGIVKADRISALRPFIVVAIFIVSAVLTPPDVISQIMMAVPTWLLFESGLLAARLFGRPS